MMRQVAAPSGLRMISAWLFALMGMICFVSVPDRAHGSWQDDPPEEAESTQKTGEAEEDTTSEDDDEADEDADRLLVITGGVVHTVSGPTLRDATIICRNGKIESIGRRVAVPDGADVIDATGMHVYPGLVAVDSRGLLGGGNPEDSTDVFSLTMSLGLAAGITTAVQDNNAAKLTFGRLDDMIVARDLFENLSYSTRSPRARYTLRKDLDRVREHLRAVAAHAEEKRRNSDAKAPDDGWIRGKYQTYLRLMKGEAVALVNASDTHGLLEICELAETYGIPIVVRGAVEGWIVADALARVNAGVIMTPRDRSDPDPRLNRPSGSTIENAAILHEHGVVVAVTPVGSLFGPGSMISLGGLAGRDLAHLSMEAAFAVRGGMTNDEAIRTITLDAARVLGIDHRVGSIEVGKDADFVITDGDLLSYTTMAQKTIVNGHIAYDKAQEGLYSHIRPQGEGTTTAPDDYWPRRLGQAWSLPESQETDNENNDDVE